MENRNDYSNDNNQVLNRNKEVVGISYYLFIPVDVLLLALFIFWAIFSLVNWNNPGKTEWDQRPTNRMFVFVSLAFIILMVIILYFNIRKLKLRRKEIESNNKIDLPLAEYNNNYYTIYDYKGNSYFNPEVTSIFHKRGTVYIGINNQVIFLGWFLSKAEYYDFVNFLSNLQYK